MINFFQAYHHNPKYDAQRNLSGRTHYVDDDTLKFHKCRIITCNVHDRGLLLSIITSDAVDPNNSKREFRFVIFDIFGTVLKRPELGAGFRTSDQARKAMYLELNKMDAKALTQAGIENFKTQNQREIDYINERLARLNEETTF